MSDQIKPMSAAAGDQSGDPPKKLKEKVVRRRRMRSATLQSGGGDDLTICVVCACVQKWVADKDAPNCFHCKKAFSLTLRRHQ